MRAFGVSGVVIKDNKILIVKHTYGAAKDKYLIPGGNVEPNEIPEDCIIREIYEETKVKTEIDRLIGIRFKNNHWWSIFLLKYLSGEPESDLKENNYAGFIPIEEIIKNQDLTDSTLIILKQFMKTKSGFRKIDFKSEQFKNEQWNLYMDL